MKHLRKVLALISNPIIYLRDYLTMSDADKGKELIERYQWLFFEWLEEKYEIHDDLSAEEKLPEELLSLYEARELYPDDLDKLPNSFFEEFLNSNITYQAISGEADAPSFLFMDFIDVVKNQWLIHFTDDAFSIASNGFNMGMGELEQLGLTTHFTDEAKKYGGYNFAFDTSDFMKYAPGSRGTWKYGKEAVVFRASGIKVWHHGDQEPQIIFFGETANSIVPIYENNDGLWIVGQRPSGEPVYRHESLENVVDWVEANYNQFKRVLAQLFAPRKDPYDERGLFNDFDRAPWEMTQKEYIESPRGTSSFLSSWERYSNLDPEDPEVIRQAQEKSIERHKESIYEALYRGESIPEEVIVSYPEFGQLQEHIEGVLLSSINFSDIRKPNHVYRGMSKEEFDTTIGQGKGLWSDKRCSFTGEGTCFAVEPRSAISYALSGYSNPKETGIPVYIVEVLATEELMFKDTDSYVKTKDLDLWVPQENVTRIFEMDAKNDDYYIKEIGVPEVPLKQAIKHLALNINKEDLSTLWYENEDGEKYFPDLEKFEGLPDDNVPEGYTYQYSRFPSELTTTVLQINPDHTSTEIMQGHATWPEDLVLAMVDSGDFTLSEAIIIASESCSRCLNALSYEYGLDDGYPEGSEEWKKSGTECDFCKDTENIQRENKEGVKIMAQEEPPEYNLERGQDDTYYYTVYVYDIDMKKWLTKILNKLRIDKTYHGLRSVRSTSLSDTYYEGYISVEQYKQFMDEARKAVAEYEIGSIPDIYSDNMPEEAFDE